MTRLVKLSNATTIPAIAWGNMGTKEKALEAGSTAVKLGIRHIDSAQVYRTEAEVVPAIRAAGLKREDVYITTKVFNLPEFPKLHSREELKASVDRSLKQLGTIPNLLLVHNPYIPAEGTLGEFWGWLEDLVEDGTLKGCSLGVSNFRPVDIETVLAVAKIKPVVNQIEFHPFVLAHVQPLVDLMTKHGIVIQAYASLAPVTRHPTGGSLKPTLQTIAQKLTGDSGVPVDTAGVLLLWVIAKGGVCITSSDKPDRIRKLVDLEKVRDLTKEEVEQIDAAGKEVYFREWTEHMLKDFPPPNLPSDA